MELKLLIAIALVLFIAVVLLGALAVVIVLVRNSKTRIPTLVVMGCLSALLLMAIVLAGINWQVKSRNVEFEMGHAQVRAQMEIERHRRVAARPGNVPRPGTIEGTSPLADDVGPQAAPMRTVAVPLGGIVALVVLLGALIGIVMLLRNPSTRLATLIGLGGVGGLMIVMAGVLYLWVGHPDARPPSELHARVLHENDHERSGTLMPKTRLGTTPRPNVEKPPETPAKPAKKPSWIGIEPGPAGDVYRMAISVGPYAREESDQRLHERLQADTANYLESLLGREASVRVRLTDAELSSLVKDRWEETVQSSVGPMVQTHALVEFDRPMQQRLREAWEAIRVERRLWLIGTALASVVAALGIIYGYLRCDLATEGRYRNRLRAAAAAILALVAGLWIVIA